METLNNLMMGFEIFFTPYNILVAVIGIFLGTIVGVLPGLGGANGVAILIPVTFIMPPTSAIILLACIYWGALFGGVITSVLFNIPGEPWSVATCFDGHPMAKKGKAAQALTAAFSSHFIGAMFATIALTFFAPLIAEIALKFGPPETFSVMMLTFSAFVALGGKAPIKTLIAIFLGFTMAAVGIDIVSGKLRLTFGTTELMGGFNFIVAVIGLFGLGEIFLTVEEGLKMEGLSARMSLRVIWETWKELPRYWRTLLRGALIGCWMGFKPGGATPASFMSYGFAKQFSKNPEEFGTGTMEGVVAPEVAAHAAGVSAMVPMITLGIPGSPTAAVMLGGLMIWGLQPGPMLFKEHPDFVWGLIASIWASNAIGVIIVLAFVPLFAAILRAPFGILMPSIVFICAIGAYAVNNRMIDIWYMIIFGFVGYAFKKLDYPIAPMVLALVLGDMAETAMRQSLIMSQGSPLIFFNRPIAGVIMTLALIFFFWPVITSLRQRIRKALQSVKG
ncbi:MAG: tripartite tricarboxylate transporter permease [candidate division NC10 bacterium]|nr:tripartite tricarboxylate transporter permease [candidate division NC10 bacterium]